MHRARTPSPAPFPLEGKGRCLADRQDNLGDDGIQLIRDATAVDPQDSVPLAAQPFVSFEVAKSNVGQVVHAAIDLDNQFGSKAGEIGHIGSDRSLASDADRQQPQTFPEFGLRPGRVVTQSTSALTPACLDPLQL